jgi:hypothetical protein
MDTAALAYLGLFRRRPLVMHAIAISALRRHSFSCGALRGYVWR